MRSTLLAMVLLSLTIEQGSPDWSRREKATSQLLILLPESGPYAKWGSRHKNPEISARSKIVFVAYATKLAEEMKPRGWPFTPWVDSLPVGYPMRAEIIDSYLAYASGNAEDNQPPHWTKYRQATTWMIRDLFTEGKSKEEVQDLLDAMAVYEKAWILKHCHSFKFSPGVLDAAAKK